MITIPKVIIYLIALLGVTMLPRNFSNHDYCYDELSKRIPIIKVNFQIVYLNISKVTNVFLNGIPVDNFIK